MKKLSDEVYILIIIIIVFGATFIWMGAGLKEKTKEGFSKKHCPDILVQKGKHLVLYNSKLAKIPGINPIKFNNLEDYVEYVKWQQSQKIQCPVLFLQHSYDIQGNSVYKNRRSPVELEGGSPLISGINMSPLTSNQSLLLDAGRNDPPYNKNSYPGFDAFNQYIGLDTPLDKIYHENPSGVSANPMDSNWGGQRHTQKLINKGYYDEMQVFRYKSGPPRDNRRHQRLQPSEETDNEWDLGDKHFDSYDSYLDQPQFNQSTTGSVGEGDQERQNQMYATERLREADSPAERAMARDIAIRTT
jgi:hypothetical protein